MSSRRIGVRREDKNRWEARVPIMPEAANALVREGFKVRIQPSPIRVVPGEAFVAAGAEVEEDLSPCEVVFAIKEIPISLLRDDGVYAYFSHTIKGQPYNMAMLRRLVEARCTLIDYEKVTDEQGRRLIFFSWHAGVAGMVNTLAATGERLRNLGIETPFAGVKQAYEYGNLESIKEAMTEVAERIRTDGLPAELAPFVVGFAGYGNVCKGAWEVFDVLPHQEVSPAELASLHSLPNPPRDRLFKVVFREEHTVGSKDGSPFDLQDFYRNPGRYQGIFARHVPFLHVLVNGVFWTEAYPRLLTLDFLEEHFAQGRPRLLVVGDISCDIRGSVECTFKATYPDHPDFVYNPATRQITDGLEGPGLVIMAVDNLPCEIAAESSAFFSRALMPYFAPIARADWSLPFADLDLPGSIRRATILHRGEFTPDFLYMRDFLK